MKGEAGLNFTPREHSARWGKSCNFQSKEDLTFPVAGGNEQVTEKRLSSNVSLLPVRSNDAFCTVTLLSVRSIDAICSQTKS